MYQRILVPFDASATSTKGLEEAIQLATLSGGHIRLVHVVEVMKYATGFETCAAYISEVIPVMKREGHAILDKGKHLAEKAGLTVDTLLLESMGSRVSDLVVQEARAWDADVIVLGTHGRRGVGRFLLGSDAEQVLRLSPVPVLLVRGGKDVEKLAETTSLAAPER
ncbi:universal stress protein [Aquabacterium sp. CECT 9606]|uniref:universal stress protein n=1 Tax=Aquabacterium sp. CECT 9606 TaxID=2845822 RepID=UPI001E2F982E|nr:universal stress protein [Aquabacterium sp. CECT 9606]CAH0355893.1 TRAP-T-associated universal stress protein TeaD [Aquabacterium sp. CECT 9606]